MVNKATVLTEADDLGNRRASRYRNYVLTLLIVVMALSWADRQLFAILLEKIRVDLALSDAQLGLLGGLAFGIFYATLGVPVAMLADRVNRKAVITFALGMWSLATCLCAFARGYASMFVARMAVGVGESAGSPTAQALVAQYFPAATRGRGLGLLFVHVPLGYVLAYTLGGWAADRFGWRSTYVLFGLAGILVALLLALTVYEPKHAPRTSPTKDATRSASLRSLLKARSFRNILAGGTVFAIGTFGASVWIPAFYIRLHGLTSSQVGLYLSVVLGVTGILGALWGGYLSDYMVKRQGSLRWLAYLPVVWILATVPLAILALLIDDTRASLVFYGLQSLANQLLLAPLVLSIQEVSGSRRRAQGAAIYLFAVNLVAASLGPMAVGVAADLLGTDGLRYALLTILPITALWASMHFLRAGLSLDADAERVAP